MSTARSLPNDTPADQSLRTLGRIALAGLVASLVVFVLVPPALGLFAKDQLRSPVAVTRVEDRALVLADGRKITPPFLRALPPASPAFGEALKHGVEVDSSGRVFGLLTIHSTCATLAFEPSCRLTRVDLSELSAALDPATVDDRAIDPEAMALVAEAYAPPGKGRVSDRLLGALRRWRDVFDQTGRAGDAKPAENLTQTEMDPKS